MVDASVQRCRWPGALCDPGAVEGGLTSSRTFRRIISERPTTRSLRRLFSLWADSRASLIRASSFRLCGQRLGLSWSGMEVDCGIIEIRLRGGHNSQSPPWRPRRWITLPSRELIRCSVLLCFGDLMLGHIQIGPEADDPDVSGRTHVTAPCPRHRALELGRGRIARLRDRALRHLSK
jgi:hypothetical protein